MELLVQRLRPIVKAWETASLHLRRTPVPANPNQGRCEPRRYIQGRRVQVAQQHLINTTFVWEVLNAFRTKYVFAHERRVLRYEYDLISRAPNEIVLTLHAVYPCNEQH